MNTETALCSIDAYLSAVNEGWGPPTLLRAPDSEFLLIEMGTLKFCDLLIDSIPTLYPAVLFQMLPELRATLFGTNPNRKHVD